MPSSLPINKYLNFIQTVGAPGILYAVDELVDCKDPHSGTWRSGRVAAREQYYYLIRFEGVSAAPEYVPRNSIRLRPTPKVKESKYQRMEKVWSSFKARHWLQAWNPDVERYVPAQVFEVETFAMTIQFPDDPTLNEIRKVVRRVVMLRTAPPASAAPPHPVDAMNLTRRGWLCDWLCDTCMHHAVTSRASTDRSYYRSL